MIARVDEIEPPTVVTEPKAQSSTSPSPISTSCDILNTPVLIVGAGPAGLLQAYLLSRLGVRCTIIERYSKRLAAPKAHALSPRSLEICRQFGLDTKLVRELGTPRSDAYWVNFVTSLSGEHIGRLPYERMDVAVLDDTPEMIHNIPQPTFEEFISRNLPDTVEIIRNASFVSCQQDDEGVTTTVEDRNSGTAFKVKSQHVIACDGARSRVRSSLGIEPDGEDSYETMMTIHFNADLRPVLGQDRLGMLHWVMDPLVSGFLIGYDLSENQVLICNFDSKKHPAEMWNENLCRQTIDCAIGQNVQYDVLSFRPWVLSRKVAQQYRQGRVFLAGDAAHSFPPTGGLGLNSGLGDVHNLAYKIAAVQQGWAAETLLDSYGTERRHVAEVNSQQSVKNGKRIFSLLKTLGANHPDIEQARLNLLESLVSPEQKVSIDAGILKQQEHFDNLELHIGYVYGSTTFPAHASHYTPKFVPGARLPHVWIQPQQHLLNSLPAAIDLSYVAEMSANDMSQRRYSSLDLCAANAFTLFSNSNDSEHLTLELFEAGLSHIPWVSRTSGRDFAVIDGAQGRSWQEAMGLDRGCKVLVRPDQHILGIFEPGSCCFEQMIEALRQHLGLHAPSESHILSRLDVHVYT